MYKKKRIALFIAGGLVILILIKVILDFPYRRQIPPLTDLKLVSDSIRNQITSASKKAYWNPSANNLGMLGMVYHSSSNYENAALCYKLAIRKKKSNWIWSYNLGYLNKEMGEQENSIKNFETVVKENPNANLAWYYIGEGYQNMGSSEKAELAFKKVATLKERNWTEGPTTRVDYFPLRIYAKYQLARIYLNSAKTDLAEKTLQEILRDNHKFGAAYRLLGNIYKTKGNNQLSEKSAIRANDLIISASPIDTLIDRVSLLSKSDLYLLKQIDEAERNVYPRWAIKLLTNAIRVMPENKYLISKTVKIFLKMGAAQEAIPFLERHLDYYKDDSIEIKEVADLLDENGAFTQALVYYQQALKLKPNDPELQANFALVLFNAGMKEKSLEYMSELLEKDKNNIEVLSNGVYILLTMGEIEKAHSYLVSLNKLAPSKPKVQQLAAMVAERDGKSQLSLDLYEKSFNGNPADLATIEMLGNILQKQNSWGKSISLYRKALESHPNEPFLLQKLGSLLIGCPDAKLRNIDEGMEYADRALINKGSSTEIIMVAGTSLAQAYAMNGDKRTASAYLRTVIDLAQSNNASPEYLSDLGRKLKDLNQ